MVESHSLNGPLATHQSGEYASQLDDVCVRDGVEAADPGVGDGDERAQDHGRVQVHVDYDGQGGAYKSRILKGNLEKNVK